MTRGKLELLLFRIFWSVLFDDLDADLLPSLLNSLPRTLIQNQHLQPQIHPEHKTLKTHLNEIPEKFCAAFTHQTTSLKRLITRQCKIKFFMLRNSTALSLQKRKIFCFPV